MRPRSVPRLSRLHRFFSWPGWTALTSIATAAAAIGALIYTAKSTANSEQAQHTDRFTKAVEQLGSQAADVRIGAIYSLERLSRDSTIDRSAIADVLSAYLRQRMKTPASRECRQQEYGYAKQLPADMRAVFSVMSRRDEVEKRATPLDLSYSCFGEFFDLSGLNFSYSNLEGVDFSCQYMKGADFAGAVMDGALLFGTQLEKANFTGAKLDNPRVDEADLTKAIFHNVYFVNGSLAGAVLDESDWVGATIRGDVVMRGTRLEGVRNWPDARKAEPPTNPGGRESGVTC